MEKLRRQQKEKELFEENERKQKLLLEQNSKVKKDLNDSIFNAVVESVNKNIEIIKGDLIKKNNRRNNKSS